MIFDKGSGIFLQFLEAVGGKDGNTLRYHIHAFYGPPVDFYIATVASKVYHPYNSSGLPRDISVVSACYLTTYILTHPHIVHLTC
ncbi:hypothetical protein JCM15764A_37510 [Geotalea toluenoxydans]